jgi:hypothetical protein
LARSLISECMMSSIARIPKGTRGLKIPSLCASLPPLCPLCALCVLCGESGRIVQNAVLSVSSVVSLVE